VNRGLSNRPPLSKEGLIVRGRVGAFIGKGSRSPTPRCRSGINEERGKAHPLFTKKRNVGDYSFEVRERNPLAAPVLLKEKKAKLEGFHQ